MSGRLFVGIIVAAMILGPYRITADQKKLEDSGFVAKKEIRTTSTISTSESGKLRNKQLRHKLEKSESKL
jgi:hypothetical protein